MKNSIRAALIPIAAGVLAMPVPARPRTVAPDLPNAASVDAIVRFSRQASLTDKAAKIKGLGGVVHRQLHSVNGAAVRIPSALVDKLARDPDVAYISPDRAVKGSLEFANPTINANVAFQYGYDGTGIGIAVIDSGVSPHPDLAAAEDSNPSNRVVFQQSLVDGESAADEYGHGTHVAGIIIGDAAMSSSSADTHTFRGIAPNATIVSFKVLDANGNGTDSAVIVAIEEAVALKDTYNIGIINLSLGRPVYESYTDDPLCQAAEWAWNNGITVVVAAGNYGRDNSSGNNGYGTITAPGNDPYVITVGAMKDESTVVRSDDRIASYSSKGPSAIDLVVKPDLVAPGNRIVSLTRGNSTLYAEAVGNGSSGTGYSVVPYSYYTAGGSSAASTWYYRLSVTSMAAPMVSGAAALLLQQDPTTHAGSDQSEADAHGNQGFPGVQHRDRPADRPDLR